MTPRVNQLLRENPSREFAYFLDYVLRLPPTGSGVGCHPKLYRAACMAKSAGLRMDTAAAIITEFVDDKIRPLGPSEVHDTVVNAYGAAKRRDAPATRPLVNPVSFRKKLLDAATGAFSGGIDLPSPDDYASQQRLFMETLYSPADRLYFGRSDAKVTHIPTVAELLEKLDTSNRPIGPYFIPNPFTGELGATKAGKPSYRCDDTIAHRRFLTCEMDNDSLDFQKELWSGAINLGVPVAAITHSGGKSLHALVYVGDLVWKEALSTVFYGYLVPAGVDRVCSNASRLSRAPGYSDGERHQPLLYLSKTIGGVK